MVDILSIIDAVFPTREEEEKKHIHELHKLLKDGLNIKDPAKRNAIKKYYEKNLEASKKLIDKMEDKKNKQNAVLAMMEELRKLTEGWGLNQDQITQLSRSVNSVNSGINVILAKQEQDRKRHQNEEDEHKKRLEEEERAKEKKRLEEQLSLQRIRNYLAQLDEKRADVYRDYVKAKNEHVAVLVNLNAVSSRMKRVDTEIKEREENVKDLTENVRKIEQEIAVAESQFQDSHTAIQRQLRSLETDLTQSVSKIADIETKLAQPVREPDAVLKDQLAVAQHEVAGLTESVKKAREEAEARMEKYAAIAASLGKELKVIQKSIATETKHLVALKEEKADLQVQKDDLTAKADAGAAVVSAAEEALTQVDAERDKQSQAAGLTDEEKKEREVLRQVEALDKQKLDLESQMKLKGGELEEASKDIAKNRTDLQELEARLQQMREEGGDEDSLGGYKKKIQSKKAQIEALQLDYNKLDGEYKALAKSVQQIEEEVKRLTQPPFAGILERLDADSGRLRENGIDSHDHQQRSFIPGHPEHDVRGLPGTPTPHPEGGEAPPTETTTPDENSTNAAEPERKNDRINRNQ